MAKTRAFYLWRESGEARFDHSGDGKGLGLGLSNSPPPKYNGEHIKMTAGLFTVLHCRGTKDNSCKMRQVMKKSFFTLRTVKQACLVAAHVGHEDQMDKVLGNLADLKASLSRGLD